MSTIPITKRGAELLESLHRLKHLGTSCCGAGHCRSARTGRPVEKRQYDAAKDKQASSKAGVAKWKGLLCSQIMDRLLWTLVAAWCLALR